MPTASQPVAGRLSVATPPVTIGRRMDPGRDRSAGSYSRSGLPRPSGWRIRKSQPGVFATLDPRLHALMPSACRSHRCGANREWTRMDANRGKQPRPGSLFACIRVHSRFAILLNCVHSRCEQRIYRINLKNKPRPARLVLCRMPAAISHPPR